MKNLLKKKNIGIIVTTIASFVTLTQVKGDGKNINVVANAILCSTFLVLLFYLIFLYKDDN